MSESRVCVGVAPISRTCGGGSHYWFVLRRQTAGFFIGSRERKIDGSRRHGNNKYNQDQPTTTEKLSKKQEKVLNAAKNREITLNRIVETNRALLCYNVDNTIFFDFCLPSLSKHILSSLDHLYV